MVMPRMEDNRCPSCQRIYSSARLPGVYIRDVQIVISANLPQPAGMIYRSTRLPNHKVIPVPCR